MGKAVKVPGLPASRDTLAQLDRERAALREETRRAHETIQELRHVQRELFALRDDIKREWLAHQDVYAERISDTIDAGVRSVLAEVTASISANIRDVREGIGEHFRREANGWMKAMRAAGFPPEVYESGEHLTLGLPAGAPVTLTPVSDEVSRILTEDLEGRRAGGGPG